MELNRGSPPKQVMMGGDEDQEKWVLDSSADHKGNVPFRASTGVWKASFFIIAMEFSERLSYFGIVTSLIIYLTKVIHEDLKTAAKNANYWLGVSTLLPLLGGFIADAYVGRFWSVVVSTVIYVMGLLVLTMSRFVPSLKPEDDEGSLKTQELVFFVGIYLISIGTSGHKPALESFGADQFDDQHSSERIKKMSFFNWWTLGLCLGMFLGVTVIVYVQDHVGWGVAVIVLTAVILFCFGLFLLGMPFYRYRKPMGSPLTPIIQVFVAAFKNRRLPYPSTADQLYEVSDRESLLLKGRRLLCHTDKLKFLDKAAILLDEYDYDNKKDPDPWRLATITKVEEAKLVINMIPVWLSCLPFGICVAQSTSFFIKQAAATNLKVVREFSIPPASMFGLNAIGMIVMVALYDRLLVPFLRRVRKNERGISILQRIGVGIILSGATMVTAALVERKRLNDTATGSTMSALWLAPQFLLIGIGDAFALVGLQEYFYDQAPDSMRSLAIAAYLSVIGAGSFLSSLLITIIDRITTSTSARGISWFGKDLNSSRLDYFYWVLAVMAILNFGAYVVVAMRYSYKNILLLHTPNPQPKP